MQLRKSAHNFSLRKHMSATRTPYENFLKIVVPAIEYAVSISTRAIVFCAGINAWDLPRGNSIGGVYLPAACGRNPWGFASLAHCLMYGKAPNLHLGSKATAIQSTESADKNDHPCPKPEGWMTWAVDLASLEGETILDPFAGSGTTLVAAKKLGRHFLGFEISPEYCEIARDRLARIDAQPSLFQPKPEQLSLNGGE
jgi:hypothetical protein